MREEIIRQIEIEKVIAIIRNVNPDKILDVAQALYDGGVRMLEVTFDQRSEEKQRETTESIRRISEYFHG